MVGCGEGGREGTGERKGKVSEGGEGRGECGRMWEGRKGELREGRVSRMVRKIMK